MPRKQREDEDDDIDFSEWTNQQLAQVDFSKLTSEQIDDWEDEMESRLDMDFPEFERLDDILELDDEDFYHQTK